MTRKTRRGIEGTVEELEDGDDGDDGDGPDSRPVVVYETKNGYEDMDGDPVPTDDDGNLIPPSWGPYIVFEGED